MPSRNRSKKISFTGYIWPGLLHDIGKIGINEAVLRKNGKLTEEELNQIKSHPAIGANILADIKQMNDIVPGVLCHHERIDGKGYPNGLKGDQIPLIGKIVMLADSFDAMTSKRVYRDAMSIQTAFDEIEKGLGTQFDEKIGRLFLDSDRYQLWQIIQDGVVEDSGRIGFFRIRQIGSGDITEMKLKTQDYNDLTVVELQGELTADFVEMLKNTMTEHCCQKEARHCARFEQCQLLLTARGLRSSVAAGLLSREQLCTQAGGSE